MKRSIFFMMIITSLYAMNQDNDQEDYSFLLGEAGSDYYSSKAETAFLRKQKAELQRMLKRHDEVNYLPSKRTKNYPNKKGTTH